MAKGLILKGVCLARELRKSYAMLHNRNSVEYLLVAFQSME